MDEPLVNLEPDLKEEVLSFILRFVKKTHASLIYVTHDPAEARRIGGRIVAIRKGSSGLHDAILA